MVIKELVKWLLVHLAFVVILLIALSVCSWCSHGREYRQFGLDLRLYRHDATRGLFIRDLKDKDVLTYKEGHGLICTPEEDLRKAAEESATEKAYGGNK